MSISRFLGFSLAAICLLTITTHAQTRSYVADPDGTIIVFDTDTNTMIDTITVCTDRTCSPLIPAATPNGLRIYVTNISHNTVSVIDTLTNTVVDTITVGQAPWGIAITPDGQRAYVANTSGTISVIDTTTNTVIATITDADNPFGVAITPDGTRAYVSNAKGTVSVVDTSTNTIINTIPVLDFPRPGFGFPAFNLVSIVITPDGSRAYVLSNSTGKIYVIDTTFNSVIFTIPAGLVSPLSLAMSPDGSTVYTASVNGGTLFIDTFTNMVSVRVPVGGPPPFVGVTPDGTKLYIDASFAITIIDTSTATIITRIQRDLPIGGVAFATLPEVPHSRDDCKEGGFQRFSVLAFRNQGQCVKFVNEHAH